MTFVLILRALSPSIITFLHPLKTPSNIPSPPASFTPHYPPIGREGAPPLKGGPSPLPRRGVRLSVFSLDGLPSLPAATRREFHLNGRSRNRQTSASKPAPRR